VRDVVVARPFDAISAGEEGGAVLVAEAGLMVTLPFTTAIRPTNAAANLSAHFHQSRPESRI
jgi:hypothetical protein